MSKRIEISSRDTLEEGDLVKILIADDRVMDIDFNKTNIKEIYYVAAVATDDKYVIASCNGSIGVSTMSSNQVDTYFFTREELQLVKHARVDYLPMNNNVLILEFEDNKDDNRLMLDDTNLKYSKGVIVAADRTNKILRKKLDDNAIFIRVYNTEVQIVIDGVEYLQVPEKNLVGVYSSK